MLTPTTNFLKKKKSRCLGILRFHVQSAYCFNLSKKRTIPRQKNIEKMFAKLWKEEEGGNTLFSHSQTPLWKAIAMSGFVRTKDTKKSLVFYVITAWTIRARADSLSTRKKSDQKVILIPWRNMVKVIQVKFPPSLNLPHTLLLSILPYFKVFLNLKQSRKKYPLSSC